MPSPKFPVPPHAVPRGEDQLAINECQHGLSAVTGYLNSQPYVAQDGSTVLQAFVAGATTRVRHKLGRLPTGWLVMAATGSAPALYQAAATSGYVPLTAEYIDLVHGGAADCSATLWFF